jgi:hypothetical protein
MEWEYRLEHLYLSDERGRQVAESRLNGLGSDGWEAVNAWSGITGTYILLKKSK